MRNLPENRDSIEGLPGNRTVQTVLAWIGTVILAGYLVWTTDFELALAAFRQANLSVFVGVGLVSALVLLVVDTAGIRAVFVANGWSTGWRRMIVLRGASYLLGLINYELGLAMMVLLAASDRPRKWAEIAGPFFVLNLVDLFVLSLLVLTGLGTNGSVFAGHGAYVLAVIALCGMTILPLMRIAALWAPSSGFLSRVSAGWVIGDVGRVSMLDLGVMMAWRVMYVFLSAGADWLMLGAFGFDVSFGAQIQFFPILTFVSVLPVSLYGIGSTQVLMRDFYGVFASVKGPTDAVVDAFSTSLIAMEMGIRLLIGVVFLPGVLTRWRMLRRQARDQRQEDGHR